MTKVCLFDGVDMAGVSAASMRQAVATSTTRLGTAPDVVQLYWGDYSILRYVDAARWVPMDATALPVLHAARPHRHLPQRSYGVRLLHCRRCFLAGERSRAVPRLGQSQWQPVS